MEPAFFIMPPLRIKTNNVWRKFNHRWNVPKYAFETDLYSINEDYGFFKYRERWFHLSQFEEFKNKWGWQGIINDSYYSGILIRLSSDGESYQIATFSS